MKPGFPDYCRMAFSRDVVITALKVALVVGTVLVLINQGVNLWGAKLTATVVFQIVLTYMVPYCVSTYSSVKTMIRISQ